MSLYRHIETGRLASPAGTPARGTDRDRTPKIGVVWHDGYNTLGAFTRAEFRAEFEPVEAAS